MKQSIIGVAYRLAVLPQSQWFYASVNGIYAAYDYADSFRGKQQRGEGLEVSFDYSPVDEILANHEKNEYSTIAVLQDVQRHYSYLPKEVFPYISKAIGVSEATLFGVATFYKDFSLEPKGKYVIRCCDGTACHVRRSIPILERLREELGLSESKTTTDDLEFSLETVSCLGACGLAPVVTVNGEVYPHMTPDAASELLANLKGGAAND